MIERIYNKITINKKNTLIFIIVLTLLSSLPILIRSGVRNGHDLYFHISRISAVADNIKELDFFKGVYSGYVNDYGYANGLFYPDIFLYLPATLTALGMNVITSYKIFLIIINFFSILSIYITIKGISKNNYASILGTIVYSFASYRLVYMYQRSALGETLSFIFVPLIIYGIYEIVFRDKHKFYILVIGMTGIILSHLISTYIIGIFLFIFCMINIKKIIRERRYLYLIIAAIITLLLTSFFLLPMLEQMMSQKFYFSESSITGDYILYKRTVPLYLMFLEIPSLRTVVNTKYWIPSGIGVIYLYFIYKKIRYKQKEDKFIDELYIISVVSLFLITFTPIWKINIVQKTLSMIQFPWRFYIIPTVLLAIAGSILVSKFKESKKVLKYTFLISFISLGAMTAFSYMSNRIYSIGEYSAALHEYMSVDVDKIYPYTRGNIITSNNNVNIDFEKKGTSMNINFNQNSKDTYLELPLIYYKGYEAKMNKTKLEIFKTENGFLGVKINDLKEGNIKIRYRGTNLFKISQIISLISIILFVIYIIKEAKLSKNIDSN